MRVSGGVLAGRRVVCPPGIIRPAMDRMRESVFAALGDISGKAFLDLFSGSGVIALEAASRGARPVEAVESDAVKRAALLDNAALAPCRINCRFMPAERYIKRIKQRFDVIFCDPPFPYEFKSDLLRSLAASRLVDEGTLVLIHHPKEEPLSVEGTSLALCDHRVYGRSAVEFFECGARAMMRTTASCSTQ